MNYLRYVYVLLITGSLLFVYFFIARPYRIEGDCMEPAIRDRAWYCANHLYFYYNRYKQGDIIIFRYEDKIWVSRIVALAGQELMVTKNGLVLNGKDFNDGIKRDWSHYNHGSYGVDNVVKIPDRHLYVLSDKLSAHHDDSRVFGAIAYDAIIGKIW